MISKKRAKGPDSEILSRIVAEGMIEKKARDILIIDLRTVKNSIADFFVLATGTSDTHIDAISDSVEDAVYKHNQQMPWHSEGKKNKEWILLDYVDVVVNIFKAESRQFYAIEQLWGDAKMIPITTEA